MKKLLWISTSVLALSVAAEGYAADLGGSFKDGPVESYASSNRSGFYITGSLGIAEGDRSISRSVDRELGIDSSIPANATQAQIDANVTPLKAAGVDVGGNLVPGGNLILPIARDHLGLGDDSDFSSTVFGAEAKYLWHPGGALGFSLGVGATFYNEDDDSLSHKGAKGTVAGGTLTCPKGPCVGTASALGTQSGDLNFERDFDIDLIGRVHWFATNRLAFNAGAGVSFARASISGHNSADFPSVINGYNTGFNEDDSSIGYVLTVGADYWLTDRITIGASYDYKRHDFGVNSSSYATTPPAPGGVVYEKSKDSVDIEDDVHTFKAKIGFKLN